MTRSSRILTGKCEVRFSGQLISQELSASLAPPEPAARNRQERRRQARKRRRRARTGV